jgi:hypothetical protein
MVESRILFEPSVLKSWGGVWGDARDAQCRCSNAPSRRLATSSALTQPPTPPHHSTFAVTVYTMADDIQQIKNSIWRVKQAIEKEEKTKAEWAEQVSFVQLVSDALFNMCARSKL